MIRQIARIAGEDLRYHLTCLRYRLGSRGEEQQAKVLVNGSPKTGTTWMLRMIAALPGYRNVGNFRGKIDAYDGLQPGSVVHGHDPYREDLEKILKDAGIQTVLMMRDPRDQLISRLFHIRRSEDHKWHERVKMMSVEEGLMACIEGGETLISTETMIQFTQSWLDSDAPYLLVRYEDLLANPEARMVAVLNYLGLDVATKALAETVVARNRFERLTMGRKIWQRGRAPGQSDARSHYRKGIKGAGATTCSRNMLSVSRRLSGKP